MMRLATPPGRHEGRGQDEEGNGEQRVVAGKGVEQGLRDRAQRGIGVDQKEDDGGEAERDRDRHADQQKADDHREEEGDVHGSALLSSLAFGGFFHQLFGFVAGDQAVCLALDRSARRPGETEA